MGRRSHTPVSRSPSPTSYRSRHRERDRDRDVHRQNRRNHDSSHKRRHGKRRSKSRERHERHGRHSRSRSRSPVSVRGRSRGRDTVTTSSGTANSGKNDRPVVTAADLEGKNQDEQEMMKMMGFCNFDTTKGKKVEGNDTGAVHVILKRKYRQYMNRKGGFNRPLDFVA